MIEYRVQVERDGEWRFVYNRHGKPYIYDSLATALRYGPIHYPALLENGRYVHENGRIVRDPSRGRIVQSCIEWTVVDESSE